MKVFRIEIQMLFHLRDGLISGKMHDYHIRYNLYPSVIEPRWSFLTLFYTRSYAEMHMLAHV